MKLSKIFSELWSTMLTRAKTLNWIFLKNAEKGLEMIFWPGRICLTPLWPFHSPERPRGGCRLPLPSCLPPGRCRVGARSGAGRTSLSLVFRHATSRMFHSRAVQFAVTAPSASAFDSAVAFAAPVLHLGLTNRKCANWILRYTRRYELNGLMWDSENVDFALWKVKLRMSLSISPSSRKSTPL